MKNLHDKPQRPTEKVLAHTLEELIQKARTKIGSTENASDLYSVEDFIEMGLITENAYNEYKNKFPPRIRGQFDPVNEEKSKKSPYYVLADILRLIYLSTLIDVEAIQLGIKFFRNLNNPEDFYQTIITKLAQKINDFDASSFLAPEYNPEIQSRYEN